MLVGGVQSFQRPQSLFVEQVVLLEGLPYLPRAPPMHPVEVQKVLQTRYGGIITVKLNYRRRGMDELTFTGVVRVRMGIIIIILSYCTIRIGFTEYYYVTCPPLFSILQKITISLK